MSFFEHRYKVYFVYKEDNEWRSDYDYTYAYSKEEAKAKCIDDQIRWKDRKVEVTCVERAF